MRNNPFKMIGSYLGLLAGLVLTLFSYLAIFTICEFADCKTTAFVLPVFPALFGFFGGWLIHILFRKLRKI